MGANTTDDDDAFASDVDQDPLKALKRCQEEYRRNDIGHRENRYKLIERAVILWCKLNRSSSLRKKFWTDAFWAGRKYELRKDQLLSQCMQYLVDAPTPHSAKYKTACDYAAAAQVLLDEGLKHSSIFHELKGRGGIYKVIGKKRAIEEDGADEGAQGSLHQDDASGEKDVVEGGRPSADDLETSSSGASEEHEGEQPRSDIQSTTTAALKRIRIFQATKHISVAGNDYQDRLLGVEPQDRRWVLLRWLENEGDVRRIEVIDMREEREIHVRSR